MFSRLLKTRLRQVSLIGGLALLIGSLGIAWTTQPAQSSPDGSSSFLTGSWVVTLTLPDGRSQVAPCTFSADVVGAQPQGSWFCIGNQRDAGGDGLLAAGVQGNWVLKDKGTFAITGVRAVYNKETLLTFAARQHFVAEITYDTDDSGNRILTGSAQLQVQGPQGERVLQTVPGIQFHADYVGVQSLD